MFTNAITIVSGWFNYHENDKYQLYTLSETTLSDQMLADKGPEENGEMEIRKKQNRAGQEWLPVNRLLR
ncbi:MULTISPECIES: hypothetical protein [Lentimicrobium]|uniref:Uncharacterized protein n=2 Tax=Lentimicrobium TaxID=1840214 RepID=A0A0S7C283_9BACT|nr:MULTISPECIES: hypothetical protein [Lentimicrobium]MCO5262871.1 hypothetical protein [Lentimicrobium sp.]GAP43096.1 hypothetical protein TBC1_111238 [Lentimicrobium saccharophilum]HPR27371.1 hypothetical protein [Lentimicrobium sp.]